MSTFIECRSGQAEYPQRIILVNGFLTQDDRDAEDWQTALVGFHPHAEASYFPWKAKSKKELMGFGLAVAAGRGALGRAALLAANPWHTAMLHAQEAGRELATHLSQVSETQQVTLMGHSLGARVVFHALLALAAQEKCCVEQAILLGAAVGRKKEARWQQAAQAVDGRLHNCFTRQDRVLKYLYQGINLGISRPAGLGPAPGPVHNHDCTDLVAGHRQWIAQLPLVLQRAGLLNE